MSNDCEPYEVVNFQVQLKFLIFMNKVQYQHKRYRNLTNNSIQTIAKMRSKSKQHLKQNRSKSKFKQTNPVPNNFYNQIELLPQYAKDVDQLYRVLDYPMQGRGQKSNKSSLLVSPNFSVINKSQNNYGQDNISDIVNKQLLCYSPLNQDDDIKTQPKQQDFNPDGDLSNYIKPLKSFEKFIRTQAKNNREPKQSRKPLDFRLTSHDRDSSPRTPQSYSGRNQQINHNELKKILTEKDKRIQYLEQQLLEMKNFMLNLKRQKQVAVYIQNTEKKPKGNQQSPKLKDPCEAIQQRYKKQVHFLTKNNQELYQEVKHKHQQISKLKKILKIQLKRSKNLQSKLQQVQTQNQKLQSINLKLLKEKESMIKKSSQEIKLVKKMKQIWESNGNANYMQNTHVKQLKQIGQGGISRKLLRSEIKQIKSISASQSQQRHERMQYKQVFK